MSKSEKSHKEEMVVCPVGRFFMDLERVSGKRSEFFKHMTQSRIEFLKALRSLVDEKIEKMEQRGSEGDKKKGVKIEVE